MTEEMKLGAKIVIYDWIRIRPWDKVLIVTTQEYRQELETLAVWYGYDAAYIGDLLQQGFTLDEVAESLYAGE